MSQRSGLYPRLWVDGSGSGSVSQAGGVLLTETLRVSGLDRALSGQLGSWRRPLAVHEPAKVLCDLIVTLALGGDCLADVALLRAEPGVYGLVASDPTVSRTIDRFAEDAVAAIRAIDRARSQARARVWELAGRHAPSHDVSKHRPLIIDVDATLVTAHSDKEQARPTFKRGYGFHPLAAFVDHGRDGTGEPLTIALRPGNAGSNTAADHIAVTRTALAQLPPTLRRGRKVLVRTDAAGCTRDYLNWLTVKHRNLSYSVGFTLPDDAPNLVEQIPAAVWSPAYDSDGEIRDGAWVAELTGLLNLDRYPPGMRVIVRKERPHPGAQLRFTDADGHRLTAFATNTPTGGPGSQIADLELRHRQRARAEDRIRCAKDTGLRNLPLHDFTQNQIWCALVAIASELTAWMQLLALPSHPARRWEPKRLRFRLFAAAARLVRTGRRYWLRISAHGRWTPLLTSAAHRLQQLPAPGG